MQVSPAQTRESFLKWGRIAAILVAIYVVVRLVLLAGGVVSAIFGVLLYLVFGGLVALVLNPLDRLLRRAMPRSLAALVSLLVALVALGALAFEIGAPIAGQAHALASDVPKLERPFFQLQNTLAAHDIHFSIGDVASVLGIQVSHATSGAVFVSAVGFTARLGIDLLITLVAAFWLLSDHERLRTGLVTMLPGRWRTETDFAINAFVAVFGGYIRGQLALAVLVGCLAGFGCFILGVPFPLIVGLGAGAFELIPLAGPFVGAGIGALFALTVSPTLTVETLGLFVFIHIVEGYMISPRIQEHFVKLHPLVSLLALLVGVTAAGFLGAFFAVPLASLVAVIARAHVADLQATQPHLFTTTQGSAAARTRRRALLAGYRTHPGAFLRSAFQRITGRSGAAEQAGRQPAQAGSYTPRRGGDSRGTHPGG